MEELEMNDDRLDYENGYKDEIYSKAVRAGKRTYFFDVKLTRKDELYLTITESKKRFDPDGNFHFEKHKIFLYKEDFDKFIEGLDEVIGFIDQNQTDSNSGFDEVEPNNEAFEEAFEEVGVEKDYTKIDFEAL